MSIEVQQLTRNRDAARMIIGPLSERADLVDACEDVVRNMAHLKRVIDSKTELIDRLVTDVERLRSLVKELQDLTIDQQMEIERLKAELDEEHPAL